MGSRLPAPYLEATELDTDAAAILSLARRIWERLTGPQKQALREGWSSTGALGYGRRPRLPTRIVLANLGLAESTPSHPRLTGLGVLVREVGTRSADGGDPR